MTPPDATCWTLIHAAAGGDRTARNAFARIYEPIAKAYFAARWKQARHSLDDAVQDVFVECFKTDGVLHKVIDQQPDGFRGYFHGVLRNIALRHEAKRQAVPLPPEQPADDTSLSVAFDKAWARAILKEAARVQAENAKDERAKKRLALLQLRFSEGLPIRDIAARWNEDAAKLHHEYATAREEFRAALLTVLAFHQPTASPAQLEATSRELLGILR
jgi:DNA-directed RNA polymerase specialized sigma24 family protein